jgi:hypothetical protein
MSWWDFGESRGHTGVELSLYHITCGFCNEEGNFERVHRLKKENKATGKALHYEILKCGNCGNFTMVLWSAGRGLYDFLTLPWPRQTTGFPKHWPEDVGRHWVQAKRSLEGKNWDAAALMARSGIQLIARYQNAAGANLKQEIDDLAKKGILPPTMKEWAHEVRELGNDNAHPTPGGTGTTRSDATDVVNFFGLALRMIYDLPNEITQFRARKKT